MDLGGGGGSGLCSDAIVLGGHIRRKLPAWNIALLFKKGAKLGMVIKMGQKNGTISVEVII